MYHLLRMGIALGIALFFGIAPANAATFAVNSTRDSHDANPGDGLAADHQNADSAVCTLRAAVEEASALPGPDTVLLGNTYSPVRLTLGEITLTDNGTVIVGDGSVVIDAFDNPRYRPTFVLISDSNTMTGVVLRRSRGDAIVVESAGNRIGGAGSSGRLTLTANGLDNSAAAAVLITGAAATGNVVSSNWIGLDGLGNHANPNRNGIRITDGASGNLIGGPALEQGNVISGNDGYGVSLDGVVFGNQVAGNIIGLDAFGSTALANAGHGVRVADGARNNLIGGYDLDEGNVIAGNGGDGIRLEGPAVAENTINGNRVGLENAGVLEQPNSGDGIRLTAGAHHNLVGGYDANSGNVVSGNNGNGVHVDGIGTDHNEIKANWVGLQLSGYGSAGNGLVSGDGVLIEDGARYTQVGGEVSSERNVISGNYGAGVRVDGATTERTTIAGNFIGTNYTGLSSVFNNSGVVISNGARCNEIGGSSVGARNIISGNRGDYFPDGAGVLIYGPGSDSNVVRGNYIGVDISGQRALRNGSCGVIIGEGAQYNVVGGSTETERNYISGNSSIGPIPGIAAGVHIFGPSTAYNRVIGNWIGVGSTDPPVLLANWGHGVGVYAGAHDNTIGDAVETGNYITASQGHGVIVSGPASRGNLIRYNSITANDSLGIAVQDNAQAGITPPTVTYVGPLEAGNRRVTGTNAPPDATIDIYAVAAPDASGAGEGSAWLGAGYADAAGTFDFYVTTDLVSPLTVTAVATDSENNSSAFAQNITEGDVTGIDGPIAGLVPYGFELSQNYPNPFNATTVISFNTPAAQRTSLEIYDVLGRRVATLLDRPLSPGSYSIDWNGQTADGSTVASGTYFYRLSSGGRTETRKMLLLK